MQIRKQAMDTAHITEIYMQRPISLMCQSLGEWFNNALDLKDVELQHTNTREAKMMIVERDYNMIPDVLNRLREFNHGNPSY